MSAISSAEMRNLIQTKPYATVLADDEPHLWQVRKREEKIKLSRSESDAVIRLKEALLSKSAYGVLQDPKFNLGLVRLAKVEEQWIGSLNSWKRRTHVAGEQFNSLLDLLIERYKAPRFLRQAWTDEHPQAWRWHLHLAQGGSARKLNSLGVPYVLSHKMAGWLGQVPAELCIQLGFRWAQVKAMGGGAPMFHAVAGTFLREEVEGDEYWCEVMSWVIRQQDVNWDQVGPVLDYLKRGEQNEAFSLKGRTWKSVIRLMHVWHDELQRERLALQDMNSSYGVKEKYKPLRVLAKSENGKAKTRAVEGLITEMGALKSYPGHMISITQILTQKELWQEGGEMQHCASGYHIGCLAGDHSIWTMRAWDGDAEHRLLTIELRHETRTVVQVRGKCNRKAKPQELVIVEEWAKKEKLKMSKYL